MAVFIALLQADDRPADPTLAKRLGGTVAFLGAPQTASSSDGALNVAYAGRGTGVAQSGAVTVAASGRLDDRAALAAALGVRPDLDVADLILAAYGKWDAGLLDHLIGAFAFTLWDARERRLLAATDHFGVRPIHYGMTAGALVVSTAIGPVRDCGRVDTDLDDAFIADFLTAGFSLDVAATVHKGVRRLPPAHALVWTNIAIRIEPYWRVPGPSAPLRLASRGAYAEAFREAFFEAVRDRLPPTGPITIQLSGGMDSPAIAAAARAILGADAASARMRAHTVVYRGYPEEEGRFAQLVLEHLGLVGERWVAEDFLLRPAPPQSFLAGPQPDTVRELVPERAIVESAAAIGATHLNGLGADVLLWPPSYSPLTAIASGAWAPDAAMRHLRLVGELPPAGLKATARHWLRPPDRLRPPPWLRTDLVRRSGLLERLGAVQRGHWDDGPRAFHGPQWSQLAGRGDPGNTGLDLPVALPFMDVRLAALVAGIPAPMLRGKRILREAMRSWLPQAILTRPKTPLGRDVGAYVAAQPEVVERRLQRLERSPALEGWVDLPRLRAAARRLTVDDARGLARCEALAIWLQSRR